MEPMFSLQFPDSPDSEVQSSPSISTKDPIASPPSAGSTASSLSSTLTPTESTTKLLKRLSSISFSERTRLCRLISSVSAFPSPQKQSIGEDAHFITEKAVGVADGVGGWAELGVDAGLYSRRLMQRTAEIIQKFKEKDPSIALRKAFFSMDRTIGSSTACIVSLEGNRLRAANLGDSGFLVFRYCILHDENDSELMTPSWRVIARSRKQQHTFNCPFQLGTDSSEHPCHADKYDMTVESGDVIVLATDGVFDNLFEEQIENLISANFPNELSLRKASSFSNVVDRLAIDISNEAMKISRDQSAETPFAMEAKENLVDYFGGKLDDITVVVSIVCDGEEDADQQLADSTEPVPKTRVKLNLNSESPSLTYKVRKTSMSGGSSQGSPRARADSW